MQNQYSHIVLGLGATGLSVVRYLCGKGITPLVMDSRRQPPGAETKARCKVWLEGETPTDSFVWAMTNGKVSSGCVRREETNSFYANILFFSCLLTPALSRPSPHLWPARCYLQTLPISLPLLIRFVINLREQCYSSSCGAGREAAAPRCQKSAFLLCYKISCLGIKS